MSGSERASDQSLEDILSSIREQVASNDEPKTPTANSVDQITDELLGTQGRATSNSADPQELSPATGPHLEGLSQGVPGDDPASGMFPHHVTDMLARLNGDTPSSAHDPAASEDDLADILEEPLPNPGAPLSSDPAHAAGKPGFIPTVSTAKTAADEPATDTGSLSARLKASPEPAATPTSVAPATQINTASNADPLPSMPAAGLENGAKVTPSVAATFSPSMPAAPLAPTARSAATDPFPMTNKMAIGIGNKDDSQAPRTAAPTAPTAAASPTATGAATVAEASTTTGAATTNGSARGQTIEEMVGEMLRPMLLEWLEANMPRIVENALRIEGLEAARNGDNDDPTSR